MDVKHSPAVLGTRVDNLETQYEHQKSDIKELRNIVLVLAVAAVAAVFGLYVQVGRLATDVAGVESRLSTSIIASEVRMRESFTGLSHQQELLRKDMKSIEDKLDTLIKQGKSDS